VSAVLCCVSSRMSAGEREVGKLVVMDSIDGLAFLGSGSCTKYFYLESHGHGHLCVIASGDGDGDEERERERETMLNEGEKMG
jgi:hypothetical protein